jgi:hypothetical protein
MSQLHEVHVPSDLDSTASLLADARPEASAAELDRARRRAHARASRRPATRSTVMRSRLAIVAILAVGLAMSTAGAGLAVSGLSTTGSAAGVVETPNEGGGVLDTNTVNAPDQSAVRGATDTNTVGGDGDSQGVEAASASQQLSTTTATKLPFTGYAAIPVLLLGLVLLALGVTLGRATRVPRRSS